jgi:two-component system cell cycle response regulator CtrA
MRVLLVEDDATTAASIKMMLAKENFICDTTDLGEDGLEIGKLYDYDIILLDLMLPDIDGYEVLRRLRAARVRTPILILSGLGELDHKLKGLGFGADDFLTKPFDRRELVARIQAIVRRSKGHSESTIRTGKLVVNLDTRVVSVEDQPVHLTGKEYGILELLSLRKGTTLTKEMFLNHLYGGMDEPDQDHRRLCLQAAQEARPGDGRKALYRDRMGPRLCSPGPGRSAVPRSLRFHRCEPRRSPRYGGRLVGRHHRS